MTQCGGGFDVGVAEHMGHLGGEGNEAVMLLCGADGGSSAAIRGVQQVRFYKNGKAVMDFIIAFFEKEQEELAYRIYMTDALKALGGLNIRYYDILARQRKPQDNRSGAEIAADVIKRCGLVVKS